MSSRRGAWVPGRLWVTRGFLGSEYSKAFPREEAEPLKHFNNSRCLPGKQRKGPVSVGAPSRCVGKGSTQYSFLAADVSAFFWPGKPRPFQAAQLSMHPLALQVTHRQKTPRSPLPIFFSGCQPPAVHLLVPSLRSALLCFVLTSFWRRASSQQGELSWCLCRKQQTLFSPSPFLSPSHLVHGQVLQGLWLLLEPAGRGGPWGNHARKITSQSEQCHELSSYLITLRAVFPKERHLKMHRGYKALD